MKNDLTKYFRTSLKVICLAILLIYLGGAINPAQASFPGSDKLNPGAPPKQSIDPCDLMPSTGRISSQSEITCVAQFSSTPAEKVVQIQSNLAAVGNARLCSGLLEPSDFHIMMKEAKIGDCGIQSEVSYQGTPMPGYTGWMVRYYYQGIQVRVATSETYPANQGWVYDTAEEIVGIIDDKLGNSDPTDTESELAEWIRNSEIPLEVRGEDIYIPDWLDWISPHRFEGTLRGVVNPIVGEAWIYNHMTQEWRGPAKAGEFIYTGEYIVVGDDASTQIYVREEGFSDTITITDMASVGFVPPEGETGYPILWHIYSGIAKIKRQYTGEPLPYEPIINVGAEFSTTTSIRSEAVFSYDPDTKITEIFLIEGEIDYYNLIAAGPDDGSLISGEKLIIWGDGTEAVQPFDQSELESFLTAHNFKETDLFPGRPLLLFWYSAGHWRCGCYPGHPNQEEKIATRLESKCPEGVEYGADLVAELVNAILTVAILPH